MIYIYDIVLNFQEQLYDFYEWNKKDRLLNIKKIPIFRINTEKLLSIINDEVYLKEEILHKIAHETTIYMLSNNEYKYLCLFSNTEETVAVMCNEEGLIIKKSSLLFDEEDEANAEENNAPYRKAQRAPLIAFEYTGSQKKHSFPTIAHNYTFWADLIFEPKSRSRGIVLFVEGTNRWCWCHPFQEQECTPHSICGGEVCEEN